MRDWYYFGCGRDTGHYLFDRHRNRVAATSGLDDRLRNFDGTLAPRDLKPYIAAFNMLGCVQMCALSWWDHSVDTRSGSNSIVFAPLGSMDPALMLHYAQKILPWVFDRLPQPVELAGAAA